MSMLLRRLLARYFTLGAEGDPDPDLPSDADLDLGDDPAPTPVDAGAPGDQDGDEETPEQKRIAAAEKRAADAQADADRERQARRDAEARASAPAASGRDADFDREEKQLADAKTNGMSANELSWLQWQVDSNRRMRTVERNSQATLREAQETSDRAEFGRLETSNPKAYKRYAPRVEAALAEMRRNGQSAPRLTIMKLMLGDDIISGKVKPKAAPKADPSSQVSRGRTPGVRTDVSGRGGSQSEREKRRERLRNTPI